tara:strand:- start:15727 stop:16014 length:288 start_codon:yes stop_codon:yes gene_type:complete
LLLRSVHLRGVRGYLVGFVCRWFANGGGRRAAQFWGVHLFWIVQEWDAVLRADTWGCLDLFFASGIISLLVVILILCGGVGEARGNGNYQATKEC